MSDRTNDQTSFKASLRFPIAILHRITFSSKSRFKLFKMKLLGFVAVKQRLKLVEELNWFIKHTFKLVDDTKSLF